MKTQNYDYDALAEKLGFTKLLRGQRSHGQAVYRKKRRFITPDVDSHNGGIWKIATSLENLNSKSSRLGTYDADLNRIGD